MNWILLGIILWTLLSVPIALLIAKSIDTDDRNQS